jgi:hypothetical protein
MKNPRQHFYLTILTLSLTGHLLAGADAEEAKLRQRVTQFYTAVKANMSEQAETFVREPARPGFRLSPKSNVIGFRITKITPEPERNSAIVDIAMKMVAPFVGTSIEFPVLVRWKKENGEWYFDPEDPPKTLGDKFQECYYLKQENNVPFEVKLEKDLIDFGVVTQGKTLNLKFPFINQSSQEIKVEKVYLVSSYLKDVTSKAAIKSGQKGEIAIDVDTTPLHQDFDMTVFVEFQPINECARVRMKGRIFTAKELSVYTPK